MAGRWTRLGARLLAPIIRATFSDPPPRPIDQVILEMNGLSGRTVTRGAALSVAPVLRGRNQLCAIATLPIVQLNKNNEPQRNPLFEQLDPDVTNVVMIAQTVEDLIFDAIAWWEITVWDAQDYPIKVRRHDPHTVSLTPPGRFGSLAPLPSGQDPRGASVWVDGREVPAKRIIRFDSPNPGVATGGGAKAIRRWLLLDAAAGMYASDPRPLDYFTPAEGAAEVDDKEVENIIAKWRAARRKRSTGWIPKSMQYHEVSTPSPQQMQLVELQRQATLEIANTLGLDPEDLGVSTTTRTYQNNVDRRRDKINDVLSPYMLAVAQRLSMGDVTRGGHRVIFDLRDYLKSNPTEQANVHKAYKDMGVLLPEEIRDDIGRPPLPKQPTPPAADVVAEAERIAREAAQQGQGAPAPTPEDTMSNSRRTSLQFNTAVLGAPPTVNGQVQLDFDAVAVNFRVESETRTVWGLAIPYNQVVTKWGLSFRFMPGSIEWSTPVSRAKFLIDHVTAVGYALSLTQKPEGVQGKWKLGRSQAATEYLADAEDGVYDGLSAGVEFDLDADTVLDNEGVYNVFRATMRETSGTAMPAFDDARVTKVVASQTQGRATMEDCAICGQRHAPGVACASRPQNTPPANAPASTPPAAPGLQLNDDQLRTLMANPAALAALMGVPAPAQNGQQPSAAFTLSQDQITALAAGGHLRGILSGLLGIPAQPAAEPAEPRQVVNPTTRPVAVTATQEALPYRFDRKGNLTAGPQYDFSTDLIKGLGPTGQGGDVEALRRAEKFVAAAFADTKVADVATLNPNRQRPDLFVDQKDFTYPIWSAIDKGSIADATPFVLPKFSSSSGLVGAHTEAVEPTSGNYTATSQTITPSAVSGKASITREAWDQGGNPQLSGLVWTQMLRGWFEALEASAVTLLNGLSVTDLLLTTAAVDAALSSELELKLAQLQFVRGGFRMRDFPIQVDLYSALIDATDSDGRKLYPILGGTNTTGNTSEFFGDINIAGLRGRPAWALAASGSVAAKSYLFDRADVSGWATAPNRLTFENVEVRYVHIGIWGYKALACTDTTGVRTVTYDPVA